MAMYAMGAESSAEVLSYLNRALDICSHNGIENGYVLFFFYFSLNINIFWVNTQACVFKLLEWQIPSHACES